MFRRQMIVAAAAMMLAVSGSAANAPREAVLPVAEESRLDLRTLFDRAPGVVQEPDGSFTADAFAVEVIVARVDTDGKLIKACVATEDAARKFLEAPVERVQGKVQEH